MDETKKPAGSTPAGSPRPRTDHELSYSHCQVAGAQERLRVELQIARAMWKDGNPVYRGAVLGVRRRIRYLIRRQYFSTPEDQRLLEWTLGDGFAPLPPHPVESLSEGLLLREICRRWGCRQSI